MRKSIVITVLMVLTGIMLYGKVQVEEVTLPDLLVDSEWLSENLDEEIVILDTARSVEDYSAGHVPGALYLDRGTYWTEVNGVAGMFPGVSEAVELVKGLGISNSTPVVVYDSGSGLWAARVAWTLAYLGHENWAVLDGGYALWEGDGYEVQTEPLEALVRGDFQADVQEQLLVDGDHLSSSLDDYVVVDARSRDEYTGEDIRASRGGHIPGSLWVEWIQNNSDSDTPVLLSGSELGEFYSAQGVNADDSVVTLCQTGVRGAHTWLALTLAGYENVALYDGSWAEWGNDDSFPVEK